MKTLLSAFPLLIAAPACAQLVNGSFENNGAFSLEGWEWTCGTPPGGNDVPPGGGQWSVRKDLGDPDCSPSYLYQRIPFAQPGDHWTVSGWVRVDEVGWDALPRLGLASVNNGTFTTQSWIGSPALVWNFCWITDTVHATATDTAVVLLTCGTGFLGAGWFDGIELEPLTPTGISEPAHVHSYLDEEEVLHLSAGDRPIRGVRLFDAAGRALDRDVQNGPGSMALVTNGLKSGVYLVQLITDAGPATTRFVKP
ncbi:MAG TPA: T9SS type A sorting domain-containing protein [Flavobacteriales bacterium]|nr:T9SS type A sorting domain-containing protein [Flavobacteriales bacterium]